MDNSAIAAQRARLEAAIEAGEVLEVEMGTAMTLDFDEVPWRAQIRPLGFVKSARGDRLRCEVWPRDLYVCNEDQTDGVHHWLLGTFEILE